MIHFLKTFTLLLVLLAGTTPAEKVAASDRLVLNRGDHVCLIGNTLAERMQHFGYFETLLHAQFPEHDLVVRNLGYSADEVRFRPRSLDFGTPDQHLTMQQADVILAFFGFNESFAGPKGLPTFKAELEAFVTHTLSQNYNGEAPPKLVLMSPIAAEDTDNPHWPDGSATNENLKLYTRAMQQLADKHEVSFVDLFHPTLDLYQQHEENLTFNSVHLSEDGYKAMAPLLMQGLFGKSPDWSDKLEPLRAEVLEKNFQFFHRYRAVNGYYIYGGRSQRDHGNPPYTDAYVIENERGKLDDMTAVRDARIWKVARGETVPASIDDSGTRPLYDVPTNFKQPVRILPPDEAAKKFVVQDGYEVNLFASEINFPDLKNPVQITFDLKGRCWVATMPSYPQYLPPNKPNDKILILEDTDGDGEADKQTVFADGLHLPTGFELGDGGIYVAQEPNLMHIRDTNGDLVGDERRLVLHGFDSADSHHAIGAFTWGPGGGLYMHEGTFHVTQVETPYGPVRNAYGAVYRYDPTREKLETFIHYNFANPWGSAFDAWGQTFVSDASGGENYFGTALSTKAPQYTGQKDFGPFRFAYQEQMKQWFPKRVRPTSGCEFVSSRHFPPEAQGNFLLNNVIGFQGIMQHTVKEVGSGFEGKEIEPLLYSTDRNFRPVDLEFGGDGALYVVDWFNPLIGHMQHSLRDPNRDKTHGRIWRVTAKGRDLLTPPDIDEGDVDALVRLLAEPEDRVRYRARLKLREFETREVVDALMAWIESLDGDDPRFDHYSLEALWVLQHHDAISSEIEFTRTVSAVTLLYGLASDNYRVRSAATRVLGYWRKRLDSPLGITIANDPKGNYLSSIEKNRPFAPDGLSTLGLLRRSINDEHPRVRLEAVRALSFFETPEAAEIALEALKHPTDYYIDYTLRHTIRSLEPYWLPSLGTGQPFAVGNPKAVEYIVSRVSTPDLLGMKRSEPVYTELLSREGIVHSYRMEAINGLGKLRGTDMVTETLSAIRRLDESELRHADHIIADMTHMISMTPAAALKPKRDQIASLAESANRDITRKVATVALIAADGSADLLWNEAKTDEGKLDALLEAVPLIQDASVRESLYDRIQLLLTAGSSDPKASIRRSAALALASIPNRDLETFRSLQPLMIQAEYRDVAVRAAQKLNRSNLPAKETRSVIDELIKWIESVPAKERTEGGVLDAIQLARDLSTTLPRAEALSLRRKISELAIDVLIVRPVPHRMAYDRTDLYVQAGKPFEIVLDNVDIMPHNLVVTLPDSRTEVGILAEKMGASPDAFAKQFIPDSDKVVSGTGMLQPGQREKLQLTAADEAADYQYVCTFPGHWRTMWGTLHIVNDISDIPLDAMNQQSEVEASEIPQRQFIRKWKPEELAPAVAKLSEADRNHDRGKSLFKDVSCQQCHKMNGDGGSVGPDLKTVREKIAAGKLTPQDVLTSMLQPSKDIEQQYRTQIIITAAGKLHSGVVIEETDDVIKLAASPLDKNAAMVEIAKSEIDEREESKISIMPEGLLNTMTRDEVLDLLAWIVAPE
ncbi:PVC-type heme-binding CxxCH protein [Fuerstiella marisgermanici]|uniref:Outer membrane protein H.8 n=1 Tax=Fuerstiella marisgermanici TaxID=1891926 RepID=A0A1P8WFJ5_9PLAN|nr:PVC-type heme-binding CxxCH protein [Fuerstiella marisgermanici]APZ92839.1 Outer membrane protein H.8 precursor [Fuerstiella marisgermanici]